MMKKRTSRAPAACTTVAAAVLALAGAPDASAQDLCKRTIDLNAAVTEYTEQHAMDVGDVDGHQIRIFALRRTFPDIEPNCEGLKYTEALSHGYSDYIDRSGRAWGYNVETLENGDKIFSQFSGTSHTVVDEDGVSKSTYIGTATYTGGTGLYQGVRGSSRATIVFDLEAGVNEGKLELEYWLEN